MITNDTVAHLALLARIHISEEEKSVLKNDLEKILAYIEEINLVDTESVRSGASQASQHNVVREDDITNTAGEFTEALVKLAPSHQDNYFTVKKILSHND